MVSRVPKAGPHVYMWDFDGIFARVGDNGWRRAARKTTIYDDLFSMQSTFNVVINNVCICYHPY